MVAVITEIRKTKLYNFFIYKKKVYKKHIFVAGIILGAKQQQKSSETPQICQSVMGSSVWVVESSAPVRCGGMTGWERQDKSMTGSVQWTAECLWEESSASCKI